MKIFGTEYTTVKDLEYGRLISPVSDKLAQYLVEFDGVGYTLSNVKNGRRWSITRDQVEDNGL